MKSLLARLKAKFYAFLTRELHNKIDKSLMLQAEILSRSNLLSLEAFLSQNRGGAESPKN